MSFGYQILGFGSGGASGPPVVSATGDAETSVGAYTVHSYTGSGNFTVTGGSALTCDILCVAGGGGGASGHYGGGAGAGGMRTSSSALLGSYTITVGAGGAAQSNFGTEYAGNKGVDSSVGDTLVCTGGGKGTKAYQASGNAGGSGSGGAGLNSGTAGTPNAGGGGSAGANTGGGGGGSGRCSPTVGGTGGSGIIIFKYKFQ